MPRRSILDIAALAGVSPATVSRAFSQPELVARDTLDRIRAVAREQNFRPNRVGRSLRSGRTRTLGLIVPTLANPVFAECLEGAERHARAAGFSVMVSTTGYDPDSETHAVQLLFDHQIDALLLTVADAATSACLPMVRDSGLPYVLVYNESADHPYVSVDNVAASGDLACALAAQGHRHLAFITGPLRASDRAVLRLQGARERYAALGLPPVLHAEMPVHTASDLRVLATLLEQAPELTALFCSNDLLASAVIADLARLGLQVPRDLSVCGFDGMAFGRMMTPPLTSLEQPNTAIGEHACAYLLETLQGDDAPAASSLALRLPHRLMTGGTVGPAATTRVTPRIPDAFASGAPTPRASS